MPFKVKAHVSHRAAAQRFLDYDLGLTSRDYWMLQGLIVTSRPNQHHNKDCYYFVRKADAVAFGLWIPSEINV